MSVEPFHLFRYLDEQIFRFSNRGSKNGREAVQQTSVYLQLNFLGQTEHLADVSRLFTRECTTCAGKSEYSHITQAEMKNIVKQAVDTVYKLPWLKQNDPGDKGKTFIQSSFSLSDQPSSRSAQRLTVEREILKSNSTTRL